MLHFNLNCLAYFRSIVSYQTTELPLYSNETVKAAPGLALYDSVDDDVLQSYLEYSLASKIYYSLKQGATSEQSSRMNAMENSSKNAGNFLRICVILRKTNISWNFPMNYYEQGQVWLKSCIIFQAKWLTSLQFTTTELDRLLLLENSLRLSLELLPYKPWNEFSRRICKFTRFSILFVICWRFHQYL